MLPAARPIDGPRWVKNAKRGATTQTDGRGTTWVVTKVEAGGRVLHWEAYPNTGVRTARTEIVAGDPDYPTDAQVIEWERAQKRAAAANPYLFY